MKTASTRQRICTGSTGGSGCVPRPRSTSRRRGRRRQGPQRRRGEPRRPLGAPTRRWLPSKPYQELNRASQFVMPSQASEGVFFAATCTQLLSRRTMYVIPTDPRSADCASAPTASFVATRGGAPSTLGRGSFEYLPQLARRNAQYFSSCAWPVGFTDEYISETENLLGTGEGACQVRAGRAASGTASEVDTCAARSPARMASQIYVI